MEMKQYLMETFQFNDFANRQTLDSMKQLQENEECVKLFSHIINSQNKWMKRILQDPNAPEMSWWSPVYNNNDLDKEWSKSLDMWLSFLRDKSEQELFQEVQFIGFDGSRFAAVLKDIPLQLNYHSIHHRAQMQAEIRHRGLEPHFVDYIGTVYRKLPG